MENVVKSRLVHFYVPFIDPITGEERRAEQYASHGMRLHSEEGTSDGLNVYNVSQEQIDRLKLDGHLFSDLEVEMMEAGVTDAAFPESTDSLRGPLGDTMTSPGSAVADPDHSTLSAHGGSGGPHPLGFAEMAPWQLEEYIRNEEPTENDILEAVGENQDLARRFLDAENAATGGAPREGVVAGLAAVLGAAGAGPETEEGLEHTLPDDGGSSSESGAAGDVPTRSASKADWERYAQSQGYDSEGKSRDDLAEHFLGPKDK